MDYRNFESAKGPRFCRDAPLYLEMWDPEPVWTGKPRQPIYQVYKGQVKLAVYSRRDVLTVHVIQARHLGSKVKPAGDVYVKVCLLPDNVKRLRFRTDVYPSNNNPIFDEKFAFEIDEDDRHKRLSVSVWSRNNATCELLGCTSFSIANIQAARKTVSGWYYLLAEEVGTKKHLQAPGGPTVVMDKGPTRYKPALKKDIVWTPHPVTVSLDKCSNKGYGFSMTGCSPVVVSKVKVGSPADVSGLQKDDRIVAVNGVSVSGLASHSIAQIVRNAKGSKVILRLQRPQQTNQSWDSCSSGRSESSDDHQMSLPYEVEMSPDLKARILKPVMKLAALTRPKHHRRPEKLADFATIL